MLKRNTLHRVIRPLSLLCTAVLFMKAQAVQAYAETFEKGGLADYPAVETYASWMQFAYPSELTPAIDQDGCLNYALAKLAIRYNLPVAHCSVFQDSYSYYDAFVHQVISNGPTKSQSFATYFSEYVTLEEQVAIVGNMEESMAAAYRYCVQTDPTAAHAYILKLSTATGSDHYVLVDQVDTEHGYLTLLDSGSRYVNYLGDEKTKEKGYRVTRIDTFSFSQVPGDFNGDFQLTHSDAALCMQQLATGTWETESERLRGDADGNGSVDLSDVIHIAKYTNASETTPIAAQVAGVANETTPVLPADVIPLVRQITEQVLQNAESSSD